MIRGVSGCEIKNINKNLHAPMKCHLLRWRIPSQVFNSFIKGYINHISDSKKQTATKMAVKM